MPIVRRGSPPCALAALAVSAIAIAWAAPRAASAEDKPAQPPAAAPATPPPTGRDEPLDQSLRPELREGVSDTFRDMGVVQRKAMAKAKRFLFSTFMSLDFSDGPYTLYSLNTNPGYAINDFWEVYASVAPVFIASPREIVRKVESLTLSNGQRATIVSPKARRQFGVEVLWAPLYGKDSLGIRNVVRSDTFFKLGAAQIQYESGSGLRFVLGVGKTFFLGSSTGLRVTLNGGQIQTIVDGKKSFRTMALAEFGLVLYL